MNLPIVRWSSCVFHSYEDVRGRVWGSIILQHPQLVPKKSWDTGANLWQICCNQGGTLCPLHYTTTCPTPQQSRFSNLLPALPHCTSIDSQKMSPMLPRPCINVFVKPWPCHFDNFRYKTQKRKCPPCSQGTDGPAATSAPRYATPASCRVW